MNNIRFLISTSYIILLSGVVMVDAGGSFTGLSPLNRTRSSSSQPNLLKEPYVPSNPPNQRASDSSQRQNELPMPPLRTVEQKAKETIRHTFPERDRYAFSVDPDLPVSEQFVRILDNARLNPGALADLSEFLNGPAQTNIRT